MVGSSIIAAWSDISTTLARMSTGAAVLDPTSGAEIPLKGMIGGFNVGYLWMFVNCLASAAYVSDPARIVPHAAVIDPRCCACESESR
jgi:GDP-mannose transporter